MPDAPQTSDPLAATHAGPPAGEDSLDATPAPGDTLERALAGELAVGDGAAGPATVGQVIAGRYRLEGLLGAGGMGQVFRATHLETGGGVALKLLHPGAGGREQAERRFRLEARNAAALQHANTVRVADFGADDGRLYLAMELVDGEALSELLAREGALPWRRAARILGQVLKALWEAHEHPRRIVHRDIKPANILVADLPGEPDFVKVLDFGVSRALEGTGADTQGVIGSPHTMAPEQWRSEPVDGRTDLYALGCTAYQMLSGDTAFQASSVASFGHFHVSEPPPPLAERVGGEVPAALVAWVERMMAKAPGERYQSAAEALEALEAVEGGDQAAPRSKGQWSELVLRLVLLAIGGVGIVVVATQASKDKGSPTTAAPAARATPERRHCGDQDAPGECRRGYVAWCDETKRQIACCDAGMVPDGKDGACGCAPGGTRAKEAVANGCATPAQTAAERREAMVGIFRGARDEIRACYDAKLQDGQARQPSGRVVLGLSLGPLGEVYGLHIKETSFPQPEVQHCVVEHVKALRFPEPADGWVSMSYPLVFKANEPRGADAGP